MEESTRAVGSRYEALAASYLEERGCRVLEKNFTCRQGEIDLIVNQGTTLVFVEVKYRKDARMGFPAQAVTERKKKRLIHAARYYMADRQISQSQEIRFDVIAILGEEVTWIPNAFGGG